MTRAAVEQVEVAIEVVGMCHILWEQKKIFDTVNYVGTRPGKH